MRAVSLILLLAACGGSSSDGGSNSDSGPAVTTIAWSLAAQSAPVTTTVMAGTPVRWHSSDGVAHSVVPNASPPPTMVDVPGGGTTATQTISTPGSYAYHCGIHPNMRGTLIVQ